MFDQLKNLGGLGNLGNLMGMAQEIPQRMEEATKRLGEIRETGSAGGGLVEVDASGKGEVLAVRIDPQAMTGEDPQVIQDLFLAATNDALAKTKKSAAAMMKDLTSDVPIPGLSEALAKFSGSM